jgi:sugar phosphate isomerase/epimerase
VRTAIEVADTFGITIVIEPICYKETNTINTISDAIALTDHIGDERLKWHADTYHMFINGESMSELAQTKGRLAHLHVARANEDRGVPCEEDAAFMASLGDTLAAMDYDGYVSIEATYKDFANEIVAVRPLLQKLAR